MDDIDLENWPNCATPDCENKCALLGVYPGYCYPCNVQLQGKEATDAQYRAAFGDQWGRCDCECDDVTLGSCKPLPAPYTGQSMPWSELHCRECCAKAEGWKPA